MTFLKQLDWLHTLEGLWESSEPLAGEDCHQKNLRSSKKWSRHWDVVPQKGRPWLLRVPQLAPKPEPYVKTFIYKRGPGRPSGPTYGPKTLARGPWQGPLGPAALQTLISFWKKKKKKVENTMSLITYYFLLREAVWDSKLLPDVVQVHFVAQNLWKKKKIFLLIFCFSQGMWIVWKQILCN